MSMSRLSRLTGWWRQALLLTVVAALAVAFVAAQPRTARANGTPRFKATEIADAVLFNEGPAAGYLSMLRRGPMAWNDTSRELRRRVNEAIEADQQWAGRFAGGMQSGDPKAVTNAVIDLATLLRQILNSWYGQYQINQWVADLARRWIHDQLILDVITPNINEYTFDLINDAWYDASKATDEVTQFDAIQQLDTAAADEMVSIVLLAQDLAMESDPRSQLLKEIVINDIAAGLKLG